MLPLHYAMRNVLRQPLRLLQVVIGIALVVNIVVFAAAFSQGMQRSLATSGDPRNVIILGAGSEESVERSQISPAVAGIVSSSIGGLATVAGQPAVSPEVYYNGKVTIAGATEQAILRGVTWQALAVHQGVRLMDGYFPQVNEIMVGQQAAQWLGVAPEQLAIGKTLTFEGQEYRISGRFIAPQSVQGAEIWMNLQDLMTATDRQTLSSVVLRRDTATFGSIDLFAVSRLDLEIVAISEDVYHQKLNSFFQPIRIITWITAFLIVSAALFGGLNTMYAAVVSRVKEFATLQAIGFRRWMLVLSVVQEAVMTGFLGALFGLVVSVYLLDGQTFALSTGVFSLLVTPEVLVLALITGLAVAIIGIIAPVIRCLFPSLAQTLRA